jgi:hypothetical protein
MLSDYYPKSKLEFAKELLATMEPIVIKLKEEIKELEKENNKCMSS